MTLRDDALHDRSLERSALEELWRCRDVELLALEPLEVGHHAELVDRLLGLVSDVARQVRGRTEGNPLFAVQLVGDWVGRGVLVAGPAGFELADESTVIPDAIHGLWTDRVDRFVRLWPSSRHPLEIAAAMGPSVDLAEWAAVCTWAGARVPPYMVTELVGARLATRDSTSWSFFHNMLRESIRRGAWAAGRWVGHHSNCADVLAQLYPGAAFDRRAEHLIAAGREEEALAPLCSAIAARLDAADYPRTEQLLDRYEATVEGLALAPEDPRRAGGWTFRSMLIRLRGAPKEAEPWVRRAVDAAARFDWAEVSVAAHCELGYVSIAQGMPDEAAAAYSEAARAGEEIGDDLHVGLSLHGLAHVNLLRGSLEEAERLFLRAESRFDATGDLFRVGWCHLGRNQVYRRWGDTDAVREALGRARALFEQVSSRDGVAHCTHDLGEQARTEGQLDEAATCYRFALAEWTAIGSRKLMVARLNLGLLLLETGRFDEAGATFETAVEILDERNEGHLLPSALSGRLACISGVVDGSVWDAEVERLEGLLTSTGMVSRDNAMTTDLAGDRLLAAGDFERARRAWTLALEQWRGLGEDAAAAAVEAKLQR